MTIKIIQYNTADQNVFAHNTAEILINGSDASLIKRTLTTDEMLVATGRVQSDSDLGASTVTRLSGNATWNSTDGYDMSSSVTSGYLSMSDDTARDGITPIPNNSQFNFGTHGTIRFKVKFPYSGNPAITNSILCMGDSTVSSGLGSLLALQHTTGGALNLLTRDDTNSQSVNKVFGGFSPVAGQEYEFELNMKQDAIGRRAKLFIDGVLLSEQTSLAVITNALRDFLYFGMYYVASPSFLSEITVRDIQVFDEIQHDFDFTQEIPRIVNLYPFESSIEPSEYSLADGFSSMAGDITGDVRYNLKIENTYYYLLAGVLTVSDKSFAQSNVEADWNLYADVVSSFIESGARITFNPVLSSGASGIGSSSIVSNTVDYDFFALPVTCTECVLYGFIKDNCSDIASGTIRVYTKKPILAQGNLLALDETVDVKLPNGFFEMPLVIPNTGEVYKLEAKWVDTDGKSWKYKANITIPNQTSVLLKDAIV